MSKENLKVLGYEPNEHAVQLAEELLERLKSGESVACAMVEVRRSGTVATAVSKSNSYHYLNSGAARLAAHLALEADDC